MNASPPAATDSPTTPPCPPPRPTLLELARTWGTIGSQSLGGGPSTLYLMRALLVERRKWVDPATFRECWSIGQASPGIHLIALSGLLGHHLGGLLGIVVSVGAMVLPAAFITALLTAGLVEVERYPVVQGILRGIVPATGGMTIALAAYFGRTAARKERIALLDWGLVVIAGLLVGVVQAPVALVLFAAAAVGALSAYAGRPAE